MTTKLQKLFPQQNAYGQAPVTNNAGAPAYTRGLQEQTLQVLMVGNLEGTYYASAAQLASDAIDILTRMAEQDAVFLAKAIVYARNEGYLRIAPIVGLLVLSKVRPDLFKRIFRLVILQPGDLQDFVTLVRSKSVRSTGKSIRQAVGDWMNSISPYHVVKYGAPQKKPGAGSPVNLRDILRLTHPVPAHGMDKVFSYIVKRIKGEDIPHGLFVDLPEQIQAYETFKELTATPEAVKVNEKEALKLIEQFSLPYEIVTARLSTPGAWKALASKAPYMNMLRNLNNYEKYGVFKDRELKAHVIGRLTDPEQIAKSKQFPFRFLAAYNAFQGDPDIREALVRAVEISVSNIPDLGVTLVAPDESGSMGCAVSERSDISCADVGNLFAAALWKKSKGGFMVPFTTRAMPVGYGGADVNRGDSIVSIAKRLYTGGGTALSAPLDWAIRRDFDTGIFLTDSESWYDLLYRGHGVLDSIRRYRSSHPKTQFFFVQLVQTDTAQVPQGEPGVHFIYGWSDNVLKYISNAVAGKSGQVEAVNAVEIPEFAPRVTVLGTSDKPVKLEKIKRVRKTMRSPSTGKVPRVHPAPKAKKKAKSKKAKK